MKTPLPIDQTLPELLDALKRSRSVVLVAPPGAGKTTRVPPALLEANVLSKSHPNIVMLQPRRVAARASAMRIASENNWQVGREVGYHVRFDRALTPATRIRVLTEGILTRQLVDDPFLEGVGVVILDEFHERSLNTDLCLALLREVQQTVREDLILVVMSATLHADPIATFLGSCPIVSSSGRAFPVEVVHRADPQNQWLDVFVSQVVRDVLSDPARPAGDVLIFLPGVGEINSVMKKLEAFDAPMPLSVMPLHGSLDADEQMAALKPALAGVVKVVLATNIAETSLTIDGVTTVIDSGLARVAGFDVQRGLDRLDLSRISRASADQRAGRAGRTAPGVCIRLWSTKEHYALDAFDTPEIHRVDLAGTVLQLHAWGKPDPRQFGWFEAPDERSVARAELLLARLGALTSDVRGQITPVGQSMVALPLHPRLARLVVGATGTAHAPRAAALVALLSEKDVKVEDRQQPRHLRQPTTHGASDVLMRLDLLDRAEHARFAPYLLDEGIDPGAARQVARVRDDVLRSLGRGDRNASRKTDVSDDDAMLRLILLAYPDRVCRRRSEHADNAVMVGGSGVKLTADSVVRSGEFFVAVEVRHDERSPTREASVRVASRIEPKWLEQLFPQSLRREQTLTYDDTRRRVVARSRTLYLDMVLREDTDAPVDALHAGPVLAGALRPVATKLFADDPACSELLARVALLRRHLPEHRWPTFDDAELADVIGDACAGRRSFDDLTRGGLVALLTARLAYPLDRLLDQHAPPTLEVPSGSQIRVDYAANPPVLAVRLQELFGLSETPRIAAGRVGVRLHLLAPNYRPVQITEDLKSFWANTYFQVRKDLRARYPKHSWPDDPLTAPPQARGARRR